MSIIKQAQARRDVSRELVESVELIPVDGGWSVRYVDVSGNAALLADAKFGKARVFRTADAALRAVADAGWRASAVRVIR